MASTALARKPFVIRMPSPKPIIVRRSAPRGISKAAKAAKRIGTHAANVAREESHRTWAMGGAFALGYAQRKGWKLPKVDQLGTAGTWGLALWALNKYGGMKSKKMSHAATGLLCIAAYQFGLGGDSVQGTDGPSVLPL